MLGTNRSHIKVSILLKSSVSRALLKYGYSSFTLVILEYCEPSNVIAREQFYLSLLCPEYNILQTAGSLIGFKHSDETRKKISDAMSGENNHMFGKNHSDETRKKMSKSSSTSQRLEVFDIKSNQITTYDSVNKAAIALNINVQAISNYFIRNQQKPYKGQYIFKKI